MNSHPTAALAAARLQNLPLPLGAPRSAWPTLLDRAAEQLAAVAREIDVWKVDPDCADRSELLARELRTIAAAMRAEVRA